MNSALSQNYAAFELFLDLHYALSTFLAADAEDVLIYACIAEAALRPHLHEHRRDHDTEFDGSISRLLVADRTGLPRETVRRKITSLMKGGFVIAHGPQSVSIAAHAFSTQGRDMAAAVERYRRRTLDQA